MSIKWMIVLVVLSFLLTYQGGGVFSQDPPTEPTDNYGVPNSKVQCCLLGFPCCQ
jgi:hypothetical protein